MLIVAKLVLLLFACCSESRYVDPLQSEKSFLESKSCEMATRLSSNSAWVPTNSKVSSLVWVVACGWKGDPVVSSAADEIDFRTRAGSCEISREVFLEMSTRYAQWQEANKLADHIRIRLLGFPVDHNEAPETFRRLGLKHIQSPSVQVRMETQMNLISFLPSTLRRLVECDKNKTTCVPAFALVGQIPENSGVWNADLLRRAIECGALSKEHNNAEYFLQRVSDVFETVCRKRDRDLTEALNEEIAHFDPERFRTLAYLQPKYLAILSTNNIEEVMKSRPETLLNLAIMVAKKHEKKLTKVFASGMSACDFTLRVIDELSKPAVTGANKNKETIIFFANAFLPCVTFRLTQRNLSKDRISAWIPTLPLIGAAEFLKKSVKNLSCQETASLLTSYFDEMIRSEPARDQFIEEFGLSAGACTKRILKCKGFLSFDQDELENSRPWEELRRRGVPEAFLSSLWSKDFGKLRKWLAEPLIPDRARLGQKSRN